MYIDWTLGTRGGETQVTARFSDGTVIHFYFHVGIFSARLERVELEGLINDARFRPPLDVRGNKSRLKTYWDKAYSSAKNHHGSFTGGNAGDVWQLIRETNTYLDRLQG